MLYPKALIVLLPFCDFNKCFLKHFPKFIQNLCIRGYNKNGKDRGDLLSKNAIEIREHSYNGFKRVYLNIDTERFLKELNEDREKLFETIQDEFFYGDNLEELADRFDQHLFNNLIILVKACSLKDEIYDRSTLKLRIKDLMESDKMIYLIKQIPKMKKLFE